MSESNFSDIGVKLLDSNVRNHILMRIESKLLRGGASKSPTLIKIVTEFYKEKNEREKV